MRRITLFALLGILMMLLSACGQTPAASNSADVIPDSVDNPAPTAASPAGETVVVDEPVAQETPVDYCVNCHTDKQQLIDTAKPVEQVINENKGEGCGGEVPPLEAWQKVLVSETDFGNTVHGHIPCTSCHGGVQSADKDTAHTGIVSNPSLDPEPTCGECHPDIVAHNQDSLHVNMIGYWTNLDARSMPASHPALEEAVSQQCTNCHATCGECHVSQPRSVGGGLVNGHKFNRSPSMIQNCTACHGSRVGDEYLGKNEGVEADVHFSQANMTCVSCHTGSEMHGLPAQCNACHPGPMDGQLAPPDHRYAGVQAPSCESCHPKVAARQDDIVMHQMHGGDLSCQVCHSVSYSSCDGCHVAVSDKTGNPYYETEGSYLTFLIGRNPIPSYERPYQYVPVRHVPVTPNTFDFYGKNLLSNFDNLETWKYATPHNIQRNTPQTANCNACHGNPAFFLTADKVSPEELAANRDVIVDQLPPLIGSGDQIPNQIP